MLELNMPGNTISSEPSEADYVSNANIDKIFVGSEFKLNSNEKGKYIWKVEDVSEENVTITNGNKLKIQLSYNLNQDEVYGISLKKFENSKEVEKISISNINLAHIQEFLDYIKKIDLKAFSTNRVYVNGNNPNSRDIINQIKTLLDSGGKINLVKTLLKEEGLTNEDIVNTGFRKRSLEVFKRLLQENYIPEYKKDIMQNPKAKDETAWQHFFQNNPWIFGYGLDYRFIESSNREVEVGYGNIDFASFNKFSVLVEIKTPNTNLIKKAKVKEGKNVSPNRADSWSLNEDLINAFSQILGYKAKWQVESELTKNRENYDSTISNFTADPKCILIIGTFKSMFEEEDNPTVKRLKQVTFELFRRDSRNIEIITFDELYERACFIVNDEYPTNQ